MRKKLILEDVVSFLGPAKRYLRYIWQVKGGIKLAMPREMGHRYDFMEGDEIFIVAYQDGNLLGYVGVRSGDLQPSYEHTCNQIWVSRCRVKLQGQVRFMAIEKRDSNLMRWRKGDAILLTELDRKYFKIENLSAGR